MNECFLSSMRELLGGEYEEFIAAYEGKPRHKALRVNTLKISTDEFKRIYGGELRQNPLCPQSFYCDVKPSLDPLYHAGLYYMQEPSASAAVCAFAPFIGGRVLDLCAAPGGKSTQAAAFMTGGTIFCNDPEYKRTRALCENIERLGITNAVVTCNTAVDFRRAGFDGYFDTLIVDAPCSGGGMTRYETVPYSQEIVEGCAARQRVILSDAAKLLCSGGYMLYSTCTFSVRENEDNVKFLESLGMETVELPLRRGEAAGINCKNARRIYPHNFDGEGHFYCVLKKLGGENGETPLEPERKKKTRVKAGGLSSDAVVINGRTVLPIDVPRTNGLNVLRLGAAIFNDDGSPSHALTHALTTAQTQAFGSVELGELAQSYIRGEQLEISAPRGELIATVNGYALGLVKSAPAGNGACALKNRYPKSLRV